MSNKNYRSNFIFKVTKKGIEVAIYGFTSKTIIAIVAIIGVLGLLSLCICLNS